MDSDEAALLNPGTTIKRRSNDVFALSNLESTSLTSSEAAEADKGKRADMPYIGATRSLCQHLIPDKSGSSLQH